MSEQRQDMRRGSGRRASPEEQTGSTGVSEVMAQFSRLRWGPMENTRHDLGTDLFVQVRDQRFFDLGLVIGVQVKAGPSYFERRSTEPDPPGWWFRDDDKSHSDAWVSHGLPHLLVLCDVDTDQSWWVHVTPEAVVDTGKGVKILVPEANTLDADHVEELLEVAGTGRPSVQFEGSAWGGATPPALADRLRYALIVPRLIAPHPNAGRQPELTAAQATALLMQARFHELRRYAEELEDVPTLGSAGTSELWAWRFVAAVAARILDGDLAPLRAAIDSADEVAGHCAASVALASALMEGADPSAALEVIDTALGDDEAAPVDHAWLRLQRARALSELGEIEAARHEATRVQEIRSTTAHDVTATAITGVAATILFNTAGLGDRDLSQAIEGSDTVAAWWRTQTTSRGVTAIVERTYTEWARDRSIVPAAADEANNQLFVSALTASVLGDQATWKRLWGLLGRDTLLRVRRNDEVDEARDGLEELRRAGAVKALGHAVRRLSNDGPALAVRQAGAVIDLEASTRTTILADLALVANGGDLLEPENAVAAVNWLVARIEDPEPLEALSSTTFGSVEVEVLDWVVGLMTVVPDAGVDLVIDRVGEVTETQESPRSQAWKGLVASIPTAAWTEERALALPVPAPTADLYESVLGLRAPFDAQARDALEAAVATGSRRALGNFGAIAALSGQAAAGFLAAFAPRLAEEREAARGTSPRSDGSDPAEVLATVISFHPDGPTRDALLGYLEDEAIPRAKKRRALARLAMNRDLLAPDLRDRLPRAAERAAAGRSALDFGPSGDPDIKGEAGFIVGALSNDPDTAAQCFSTLLDGPARHRVWAARLAGAAITLGGVLPALVSDEHPGVRAAAGAELALRVARGDGDAVAASALASVIADPGREPPLLVAATLANDDLDGEVPRDLVEPLREHPSAAVRMHALEALG